MPPSSTTGAFTYTPGTSRGKLDSFTYRVTDSAGLTADATAQVVYGRTRIMPLGDSITDGVETYVSTDGPPTAERVGYRKYLYDRLTQEGYAVDFVGSATAGGSAGLADTAHEGHSGFTQAQIQDGIVNDKWLVNNPADVVLLHIGTNDVNQGGTSVASTNSVLESIDSWSASTANPSVQLLLSKLIKQRSDAANAAQVPVFNTNLTNLYNANWATPKPKFTVNLIDMYSRLDAVADLTGIAEDSTGLHPNKTGYAKMADAWFEFLVQNEAVAKCP